MRTKEQKMIELITIKEVATMVSMSVQTVRRQSHTGLLPPPVKNGKSLLWRKSAVDLYLEIRDRNSNKWEEEMKEKLEA